MIGTADLLESVNTVWDNSSLDWEFKKNWAESDRDGFEVLHDTEAMASNPFPYCVFTQETTNTVTRTSGRVVGVNNEIRDVVFEFHVHAREIDGSGKTAKEIAAELAEKIMELYGGHPTVAPTDPELTNGCFLISQYQTDYGVRTGDTEYQWVIRYIFRIDVPVATS